MGWGDFAKGVYARRKALPYVVRAETSIESGALDAIVKKSSDLEAIQKAVADAAAVGAPLWLSYIFLMFYVSLAAAAVTHADLLLENRVELPFLSIKLPLLAFFVVAPAIFVLVHVYVLAHFALLSDKAKAFHRGLKAQIANDRADGHELREGLRQQLPINIFVQFLAGPSGIRNGRFSLLLWAVAWTTLVGAPVLVLLLLQIQFLPYHDSRVTWWHRGMLTVDLAFIWGLWLHILVNRDADDVPSGFWQRLWRGFLASARKSAAVLTGALVAFSVLVATFPGEWSEIPYAWFKDAEPWMRPATNLVFGKVDPNNPDVDTDRPVEMQRISGSWPTNTLRLREFDIYAALGVDGPEKFKSKPYTFSLKNRRLESADLRFARFDNVDLREAQLQGAWLDNAKLDGATLTGANLNGASMQSASLVKATLRRVEAKEVRLDRADFRGASLSRADLRGSVFDGGNLGVAEFSGAVAHGASFARAEAMGADFSGATLTAANFRDASVRAAEFGFVGEDPIKLVTVHTYIVGAFFDHVDADAASFSRVDYSGATFRGARLIGTTFKEAQNFKADQMSQIADMSGSWLWRSTLPRDIAWRFPLRIKSASWSVSVPNTETEFCVGDCGRLWNDQEYALLELQLKALPDGPLRDRALERIMYLKCYSLILFGIQSCRVDAPLTRAIVKWRAAVEKHQISFDAFQKERASLLKRAVCDDSENGIFVLRGLISGALHMSQHEFYQPAARFGPVALINAVMSPSCGGSSRMTTSERLQLLKFRDDLTPPDSKHTVIDY